ncbi:tyrosine-type recombinase/integrase [Psychroserpens mesophilus]|uniref:tyrosine-type recombinase/integrase n=1 Tax=Psychroserpens mesophilus TaxID=325473 RepID=UPI003D64EF0C
MNKYNFSVLFLLASNRSNRNNKCALKCRITYNKKRKEFATGRFVNPSNWNSKQQVAEPPEPDAKLINTQLSLIRTKLNQAFLFLQVNESDFEASDIYLQYKGKPLKKDYGVVEVYNLYLARIHKLIGIDIKQVTYDKYLESGRHLKSFIRYKFKSTDIKFKTLKSSFVTDYEYYLKTEKKFQLSTLNKAIQRFRRVIKYALSEDYLAKDPFIMYKPKTVKKKIHFLSPEELQKLEQTSFEINRIQQIKDLFVFCCYTGLGFSEMSNLKKSNIIKEFDGNLWIHVFRNKTNGFYKVPLLPKALEIIEVYVNEGHEYIFPRMSNPKFNAYLKEIAHVVGIEFNLTHHIARKTFATTVLLYNNVPIEVVSKLLGHSKIQTTQDSYGEIVQKRISLEIERLKGK